LDVIADAAGAVGAEMGQVLAELGRVDPGGLGEVLRADGGHPSLGQRRESAQVERQAGDGRLGYATTASLGQAADHVPELQGRRAAGAAMPRQRIRRNTRSILN